jgi:alpha-D-xyloside xylohydrolase
MKKCLYLITLCLFLFFSNIVAAQPAYIISGQTIHIKTKNNEVEIRVYSPAIVRIVRSPELVKNYQSSLSVIKNAEKAPFTITTSGETVIIKTALLKIGVNLADDRVSFYNLSGILLLNEQKADSAFTPTMDADKKSWIIKQEFKLSKDEGIYGLGQFQDGVMNYRNHSVRLRQNNKFVANPFLLSTKGYGILWDNYSVTTFADNDRGASFKSEVGDYIDYYFVYGKNADGVIAGYRGLTGQSPMYGKWAYGFWQSRERYKSQEELIGVVEKYRSLKVPLDNIVQDWQYWGTDNNNWNSTEFGNPLFPDPEGMIKKVHQDHAHIMISVWPSFGQKTKIYHELKAYNLLYGFENWPHDGGVRVYDAFNPQARNIYWKYMNLNLFSKGIDAWWLDASEPEQFDTNGKIDSTQTYLGSFKRFRNAFPLETTSGVYEHQRGTTSDKRVFILTRSAFSGQQRYGASTWSGDIYGNWDVFRKQISGGLNFCMAGIPYWTTDIGGFFSGKSYPLGVADPAYQELYVRWFQFGAFSPLFRSHGTQTPREIYQFGSKGDWAYDAQEKYINLRYRLMPYIYSLAWKVTSHSYTLMRGLPMDFANDKKVYTINDQYMFGPSILVSPVTEAMYTTQSTEKNQKGTVDFSSIKSHKLYLPQGGGWYDFWTGEKTAGGKTVSRQTPIDIIPLYVKAGSIIPMGPFIQYASENNTGPIELRVYSGADADFTLYEDENDNYNYEKGAHATIPIHWDEKAQKLTIGRREGSFPGMANNKLFSIVFVSVHKGTGLDIDQKPDYSIKYKGNLVSVTK